MDPAAAPIIAPILGGMGEHVVKSSVEQLTEPEEEVTVDQLVALGILKSLSDLWPELGEFADAVAAFAEDFEILRFKGFTTVEAHETVQLIYAPRVYLIQGNHLSEAHVRGLNDEQIGQIVDDALLNFLKYEGVDPDDDLNYRVASLEDDDVIEYLINPDQKKSFWKMWSLL